MSVDIEEAYLEALRPRIALFYFYSFHPYAPIHNVCSRVLKALRGRQSEMVRKEGGAEAQQVLLKELPTLLSLIEQNCDVSDPKMNMCAWSCLEMVLGRQSGQEVRQLIGRLLPRLFERTNSILLDGDLNDSLFHTVVAEVGYDSDPRPSGLGCFLDEAS